ncbi:hypothetical protein, partial [Plastoroseomonas arctica]|uniref:hypothetical protein n=1 Tax=Plastoroseomonas arctica TaxID=1509237 RepID=UPI001BABCB0C
GTPAAAATPGRTGAPTAAAPGCAAAATAASPGRPSAELTPRGRPSLQKRSVGAVRHGALMKARDNPRT